MDQGTLIERIFEVVAVSREGGSTRPANHRPD